MRWRVATVAFLAVAGWWGGTLVHTGGASGATTSRPTTVRATTTSVRRTLPAGMAARFPVGAGATDRAQVRSMLGPPDAFEVSFEQIAVGKRTRTVRVDVWFYEGLRSAFQFDDGRFVATFPADAADATVLLPQGFDPDRLVRSTTPQQVAAMAGVAAGQPAPASFALSEPFGVDLTVRVYGQLVAAFDAQGLVFARTVPVTLEAGS